jgi:alkanesulfonate monooxygenase SsuD/methylene tetrahydromethanopterin reductase-like flavin-dependent oxidoreductase (luciferase family)
VVGAINVPKNAGGHIPVIVGGNGRNVTFRLAARFADELNLVYLDPTEAAALVPIARQRCEEIGRDPASLRLSLYCADQAVAGAGAERVDRIAAFDTLGLDRLIGFPSRWDMGDEGLPRFAEDCRAAGAELAAASG